MNSNYQWQKHQANERARSRLREAEWQRMLKEGAPERDPLAVRAWHGLRNVLRLPHRSRKHDPVWYQEMMKNRRPTG